MDDRIKAEKINKYLPKYTGTQPIRVLKSKILNALENTNPEFLDLTKKLIQELEFKPGIVFKIGKQPVQGPNIDSDKRISIQETFLSYLWCVCYSLTVLYDEAYAKMSRNRVAGFEKEPIDWTLLNKAEEVWVYAKFLLGSYADWDMELPNPECYYKEDEWWIPRINGVFLVAAKFILCHEVAHVEKNHFERLASASNYNEQRRILEKEADERAIELVLMGSNSENSTTVRFGILLGLCSLLYFNQYTYSDKYPSMDDRIHAILDKIDPEPNDGMWGVATIAYKLWDGQFSKMFSWDNNLGSYKELYYFIKQQIERENTDLH